jgi:hypothetical protein
MAASENWLLFCLYIKLNKKIAHFEQKNVIDSLNSALLHLAQLIFRKVRSNFRKIGIVGTIKWV